MNTTKLQPKPERMPQVPQSPLPELAEFLAPPRVPFTQGPSAESLCQDVSGVLSEHPNKNCDTLALKMAVSLRSILTFLAGDYPTAVAGLSNS